MGVQRGRQDDAGAHRALLAHRIPHGEKGREACFERRLEVLSYLVGLALLLVVLGGCADTTPQRAKLREEPCIVEMQKSGHCVEEPITIWTSADTKREADLIIAAVQQASRTPRVPVRSIACEVPYHTEVLILASGLVLGAPRSSVPGGGSALPASWSSNHFPV